MLGGLDKRIFTPNGIILGRYETNVDQGQHGNGRDSRGGIISRKAWPCVVHDVDMLCMQKRSHRIHTCPPAPVRVSEGP